MTQRGRCLQQRADIGPNPREILARDMRGEVDAKQRRVVVAQVLPEEGQPARERAGLYGERQNELDVAAARDRSRSQA